MSEQPVNRTIFTGDNLEIMRGMDSESVDLIYVDPPFNSGRTHTGTIREPRRKRYISGWNPTQKKEKKK